MKRMITRAVAVASAVVLVALGVSTAASAAPTPSPAPECKTVTSQITDRPDSATSGGDWAKDTFKRTAVVCVVSKHDEVKTTEKPTVPVQSWAYNIKIVDDGAFVTTRTTSPQAGAPMINGLKGTFKGGASADFEAPADWLGFSDATVHNSNAFDTSTWMSKLWKDGFQRADKTYVWGWTYALCNEQWENASGGNDGDITGHGKKPCLAVTFVDKCDGSVVVTVTNTAPAVEAVGLFTVNGDKPVKVAGAAHADVTVKAVKVIVRSSGMRKPVEHTWVKPKDCATATPTPAATPTGATGGSAVPSLPVTGARVSYVVGIGSAVVVAGAVILFVTRKRRTEFEA